MLKDIVKNTFTPPLMNNSAPLVSVYCDLLNAKYDFYGNQKLFAALSKIWRDRSGAVLYRDRAKYQI